MRKLLLPILAIAAAAALGTPASAYQDDRNSIAPYAAPVVGAAVGTAVGVGLYNGWYSGALATALPASAAGAVAAGGVAGIGTIVLIDAVAEPCRGFHAIFGLNHGKCVDGEYVGDRSAPHWRRSMR